MAEKPETRFKNRIRPLLEALPNTWAVKIQQKTISGTPDYILCVGGRFVALELKADDKSKPTPLQDYTLRQIQRAKGTTAIVSPENWDVVYSLLKRLANNPISNEGDKNAA